MSPTATLWVPSTSVPNFRGDGEVAGAVVEIDHILLIEIAGDDVEVAVAVHVAHCHAEGVIQARAEFAGRGGEVAGAVVEIDRALLAGVAGDDVEVAVAIHVTHRHAVGANRACAECAGRVVKLPPPSLR